jgi:metal-dependent amidase/aminoacylase/carboxypeptidase family protein
MSHNLLDHYRPNLSQYEEIYKKLHANPELSDLEEQTAKLIEGHLSNLFSELDIKTRIGGFGLFAVCKNGSGKTILLRADFDALPVAEKTGLEYASTKKMQDVHGNLKPVMHGKPYLLNALKSFGLTLACLQHL